MLDHVGLLSAGNEELARFAWKAFARWQQRQENTDEERQERDKMFEFLKGTLAMGIEASRFPLTSLGFRETFSRPVRRIRFLGLFDTGKFRQDLISETKITQAINDEHATEKSEKSREGTEYRLGKRRGAVDTTTDRAGRRKTLAIANERYRRPSKATFRSRSPAMSNNGHVSQDLTSLRSGASQTSLQPALIPEDDDDDDADEALPQDIQEVWFPGCHADIGGGWPIAKGEEVPLSHGPLVWMVRELQRAGLRLNMDMVHRMRCHDLEFEEPFTESNKKLHSDHPVPQVRINSGRGDITDNPSPKYSVDGGKVESEISQDPRSSFHRALESGAIRGLIHDCLEFKQGLPASSVISWRLMEYLPFRRMDLQPDGSWLSINWPLPKGETRDIPESAWIHHSALKRMQADPSYRPGNLILGGGGRGVRRAPPEAGTGNWEIKQEEGDPVGEVWVRSKERKTESSDAS
ncbi:hypothetical protein MMC25_002064 [Agyrium rufum]|nr:hypothetical protein [Agyrium rufum]